MAEDDPEQVVEVVGRARRQGAERLEALPAHDLGLQGPALVLQPTALRDVAVDGDEAEELVGRAPQRGDRGVDRDQPAVPGPVDVGAPVVAPGEQRVPQRRVVVVAHLPALQEARRLPDHLRGHAAVEPLEAGVDVGDRAVGAGQEHGVVGLLHRLPQPAEGFLGAPALGHVDGEHELGPPPVELERVMR